MNTLSIQIPTTHDRKELFNDLIAKLEYMVKTYGLESDIEIISLCDAKEMTIGEKRERLYALSSGLYSWQIDSDDMISADALPLIMEAIKEGPDCITFLELCKIDGVESRSRFSLEYSDWGENIGEYDHLRTPFFKTPIKTELCRQVQIPHIRFGEDHAFAKLIKPLLKTEAHIPKPLYYYRHISTPFNERYGIK